MNTVTTYHTQAKRVIKVNLEKFEEAFTKLCAKEYKKSGGYIILDKTYKSDILELFSFKKLSRALISYNETRKILTRIKLNIKGM